jgi:hypothetical protein
MTCREAHGRAGASAPGWQPIARPLDGLLGEPRCFPRPARTDELDDVRQVLWRICRAESGNASACSDLPGHHWTLTPNARRRTSLLGARRRFIRSCGRPPHPNPGANTMLVVTDNLPQARRTGTVAVSSSFQRLGGTLVEGDLARWLLQRPATDQRPPKFLAWDKQDQ